MATPGHPCVGAVVNKISATETSSSVWEMENAQQWTRRYLAYLGKTNVKKELMCKMDLSLAVTTTSKAAHAHTRVIQDTVFTDKTAKEATLALARSLAMEIQTSGYHLHLYAKISMNVPQTMEVVLTVPALTHQEVSIAHANLDGPEGSATKTSMNAR